MNIAEYLNEAVERLKAKPIDELLRDRYEKFRKIGVFSEGEAAAEPTEIISDVEKQQ